MKFEIMKSVSGVPEERLDELVDEAERGYDLDDFVVEPNPHEIAVQADLYEAIDAPAELDGESPERVVRHALDAYLGTA